MRVNETGCSPAVQTLIKENSAGRSGKRYRNGALLTGLLYDDRGNRMSPSFSVKNGVRYPFYVSQALLKGRTNAAGAVPRIAASTIETAVLQACGFPIECPTAQSTADPDQLNTLLQRVVITAIGCTIFFADKRPAVHVQQQWKADGTVYANSDRLRRNEAAPERQAMIYSIVRAHRWLEMLSSAEVNDIDKLAKREGMHPKIVRKHIRLAFLPPRTVSSVLDTTSPARPDRRDEIALKWPDQR